LPSTLASGGEYRLIVTLRKPKPGTPEPVYLFRHVEEQTPAFGFDVDSDRWDHSKTHCSGLNHCGSVINEQSFSMHLFSEPNNLDLAGVQHSPGNNKRFGWRCELSQAEPTVNCCEYGGSNWRYATLIDNLPPNSRRNVNLSKQFRQQL
jgi:hypothetical protein